MKKKLVTMTLALLMIVSVSGAAFAAANRASDYLSNYSISMEAIGNGEMENIL